MCLCFTFQLKSSELRLILVLSIRSLYPLRSGSFLSCSVSSDHHWRVHICCELDDSWVCIWLGLCLAWVLNGCQRDLFSSWLEETTELGWRCSFQISGNACRQEPWGLAHRVPDPLCLKGSTQRKIVAPVWGWLNPASESWPASLRRQRRQTWEVRVISNLNMAAETRFQDLLGPSAVHSNRVTAFGLWGSWGS